MPLLVVPTVALTGVPAGAAVDIDDVRAAPRTIAAGADHTVFLSAAGVPYGVGNNSFGQITGTDGAGTSTPRVLTGLPSGVTGVEVAAGYYGTLVIGSDGRVYATGRNDFGELAVGVSSIRTLTEMSGLPAEVRAVDAAVTVGRSIVVGDNGTLYGAGTNTFGPFPGVSGSPQTLTAMAPLPGGDVPAAVFGGNHNYAVVAQDGSVYGAAYNGSGQLMNSGSPLSTWTEFAGLPSGYVATSVAIGGEHAAVLLADGSVYSAGNNSFGQRGSSGSGGPTPVLAPGLPAVTGIATYGHTGFATLAIGSDGTAYGAGNNAGQFGSLTSPVSPFAALPEATPIGTIVEGAMGNNHVVVRDSRGVISTIGSGNAAGGLRNSLTLLAGQPLVATAVPTITGDPYVGSTLTAVSGTWAPNVGMSTFQWRRGGMVVASGTTYELTAADRGSVISVVETRQATDFVTGTATSLDTSTIIDPPLVQGPGELVVTGEARTGVTLGVADDVQTVPSATSRTYRWLRDGVPVSAAMSAPAQYAVTSADLGARLSVRMTASRAGNTDLVVTSAQTAAVVESMITATGAPQISGTPQVGRTLTGTDPTVFTPEVQLRSYRWLRDGVPLPGSFESGSIPPYPLTAADLGAELRLRVTGGLQTYPDISVLSAPVTIAAGEFTSTGTTTIIGPPRVGETLSAVGSPTFTPTPDTVTYRWQRDGVPVGTATSSPGSYVLGPEDLGGVMRVVVTASSAGYTPATVTSAPVTVVEGQFGSDGTVTIAGTPRVGESLTLTGAPTFTPAPDALSYQWRRDGVAVGAATSSPAPYVLGAADVGAVITLAVTATRAGFAASTVTSAPTSAVTTGTFASTPAPTIAGVATVGSLLTATPGTSTPAADSVIYSWQRNGTAIPGATSATYRLVAADAGATLTVAVRYVRAGYDTSAAVASPTVAVSGQILGKPAITGTAKVGKTLKTTLGRWNAPGYTFAITWLRAGKPIPQATKTSYKLTKADAGKLIAVRVVATKPGFPTLQVLSAAVKPKK
ncbi:hypothetical protein [Nocardioides sp.]|uniref:hypothetical protein n=1 Tax=Nocardioides sp. TaxID=35761 RepID=UPI0035168397